MTIYRLESRGLLDCPVLGVAVDDWTVDQLRDRTRKSIEGAGEKLDPKVFDRLSERTSYVPGHAAMIGDRKRFTRQDGIKEAWRVMEPMLGAPPPVHAYPPDTRGPKAADERLVGHGRWHDPWVTS
jgi:glucose-6-phosphate 1-dehydrogenase